MMEKLVLKKSLQQEQLKIFNKNSPFKHRFISSKDQGKSI